MLTALIIALLLQAQPAAIRGTLHRVVDGDTFDIITLRGDTVRIRLEGVDTPEPGQPWASEASAYTRGYLRSQDTLTITPTGEDVYGRTTAYVCTPLDTLNYELVKRGLAEWYRRYSNDPHLQLYEAQARIGRRGIHK